MKKLYRLVIRTSGVAERIKTMYVIAGSYTDALDKFELQKIMDISLVGSEAPGEDGIFEDIEW